MLRKLYGGAHRALIGAINRMGWTVARTSDYYSPLRPVAELERHVARWHKPSRMLGVAFDLPAMTAALEELVAGRIQEYSELPSYDEIRKKRHGPGFTTVDAMVLYMMLRHHKPPRYLEVGSGLSTYYAWLAAQRNGAEGRPMKITVVDPFVSEATQGLPGVEALAREAQDLPADWYAEQVAAGDVLFIDSTHIVRVDGEVPYLVLEVLPALKPGVLVHIHDIHFPYHVPADPAAYVTRRRWPMLFTEPMLVQAYLCNNPRVEIVMSTPLLRHHQEDFLRRVVPGYKPLDPEDFDTHHGSLWLRCLDAPRA
ncbi:MAG TPA: class I SAM-dependent methyltransferase [Thermoanaerobaculia bacterium]|nr:class I SAM-dependent methyltransferase [Thermoanaerobaculia bacterium]